jgi:hypothetical protein
LKPLATLHLHRKRIVVRCPAATTSLPIDAAVSFRLRISEAGFEHERQCQSCSLTDVYARGSRTFVDTLAARHRVRDRVERVQAQRVRRAG